MVLYFPLNDLTDLPNPPEELARIAHFNVAFKQKLAADGVEIVPVNDKIKAIAVTQSATYLFDHTDIAASLAEGSGADNHRCGHETDLPVRLSKTFVSRR
jgi:hypothetical protein